MASATPSVSLAAIGTSGFHGSHDPNQLGKRYLRQSRLCLGCLPAREAVASDMAFVVRQRPRKQVKEASTDVETYDQEEKTYI